MVRQGRYKSADCQDRGGTRVLTVKTGEVQEC